MHACYARVSTPDQNLARQVRSTLQFCQREFDADLETNQTLNVIADYVEEGRQSSPARYGDVALYFDRATGTNTNRAGYHELLDAVDAGEFESVVVHSVSRMSRSIRDLDRTVERIVEEGDTALYIKSESMRFTPGERDPYQRALFQMLGVFAELEAKMAQMRVREGIQTRMSNAEYHHGPAPLGFTKNDGHLIEADGYDRVRTVLWMVDQDEMSKRMAAKELDTSRKSIYRALDRPELYGLAKTAKAV